MVQKKKYFELLKLVFISGCIIPLSHAFPESITIKDAPGILPVSLDIPPDWEKNQIVKSNGIILSLKQGNSQIEIRSFISPNMNMDFIINAKAARLYANNSYINLLLDKSEATGNLIKRTLFWQIVSRSKSWFEKTLILQYQNHIVILSCTAPELEYRKNRVIFENALLSLKFDIKDFESIREKVVEEKKETRETEQEETTDNGTKELIRAIEDDRENKANKMEKLKQDENAK